MGDRVRLVCFDLGGVIIRICQTWAERCAAAGLAIRNPELWDEIDPVRDELMVQYQTGCIEGIHFARQLSAALRGLYSPAEIMAIHDAWLIDEYEGVDAIVDRLHQVGLETAALTNTTPEHWVRMPQFPTVGRLRHRLASHELGLHKPDPAIYLRLERQLGYAGREILFFDDTEENVQAAQAVGWTADRIDPAGDTARQMAEALAERGVAV
ncbi:MAG: HAD-IA family hydrolase [Phycisphaerales bacterium]